MTASSREPTAVRGLFASIAPRYDFANHLLSGGLDYFWRRHAGKTVRAWAPERILDLATGSGDLALTLGAFCPDATIIAADFCPPMLHEARRKGVRNLVAADGLRLPFPDAAVDVVTIAFGLRNMASWPGALREMRRVLRPGGHVLILDFSIPPPPLRALYGFYLRRCLPWIGGVITGERTAYEYLAESIEGFPRGGAMVSELESAGFLNASARMRSGGIVSFYAGER